MTTPKIATIKRGDSRFYVHPNTREKVPGVTSVVGMLPKGFLKFWAAKVTAECAVTNIGPLVGLAMSDPAGAVDYLKGAHRRSVGNSADIGTEVHDLCERLSQGENVGRLHPDIQPYVDGWHAFNDQFSPEFLSVECTVWSETHGYAGSYDAIVRIGDDTIILDYKTTRSGVHAEVALQLAAYKNADYILNPDGSTEPLPEITGGAVLHLRPEGWQLVPVAVTDEVFEVFCSLIPVITWDRETSKSVIGAPIGAGKFEVAS